MEENNDYIEYICVDNDQWKSDPFHCNYLDVKVKNRNDAKVCYSNYCGTPYSKVKVVLKKNKHLLSTNIF